MKKITLGTTYYQNPENLQQFIECHYAHVDEIIIVDDGSTHNPISKLFINDKDKKIKLFRVKKDYGFNSHGCRNLIMTMSNNDWVVLLDCDRIFLEPKMSFETIKNITLNQSTRYRFTAHVESYGKHIHGSVNDFLIHKKHFFSVGGYDEELIGVRNGDRSFFKQLLYYGNEKILNIDILLTRKASSSYKNNIYKSPLDKKMTNALQQLLHKRENKPNPNKPILTFDWETINPNT